MSEFIEILTDGSFNEKVIDSKGVILVDFWAPWCGPCRTLAPTLESIAKTYKDKVKFFKINVDENNNTATKYNIRSIPTLILFKDGKATETKTGGGVI